MKIEIITDVDVLNRTSNHIKPSEIDESTLALVDSIPDNALGLAAIQIGIPHRIFLVNLNEGSYVFINPEIIWKSSDKQPSMEACLSIPDVSRCLERHAQIKINAETIITLKGKELRESGDPIHFKHNDAFIIQHEYDHINGVLITDHETTKTPEERISESEISRKEKIAKSRVAKKNASTSTQNLPKKISSKAKRKLQKQKRVDKTFRKQNKMRVEIEERYRIEKEGILKKDEIVLNPPQNEDQSPSLSS